MWLEKTPPSTKSFTSQMILLSKVSIWFSQIQNNLYSSKGRVVFPILYAGFLAEFKFNIKSIQIITTLLTGIITFFTSLTIYQKYGFLCSLIFSCLCSDFLVEHVGGGSTENIGYILGGIAFIFFFKLLEG